MKILHVTPTYLPAVRYGGPIVAVHGLCRALAARGHAVDVFTTNVDGDGALDVPVAEPVVLDGVRVHYFPSPFPRLYWSPAMRRGLGASLRGYDIVHIHAVYLWPGVAAGGAARRHGVPYVISPRGMLVPGLIAKKSRLLKSLWLRLVERQNFAGAAGVHFTSPLEWEEAMKVGLPLPSPFVVPNGIELVPRPFVPREERVLLFLGRINWKKGLEPVIQLLASLPNTRLVIAGNDEEELTPRLEELAVRSGVGDRVEFFGPVHGDAKWELMARATLFVLNSDSENFGNVVLEALSMETPVVLSQGVGLAEEVLRAGAGAIGLEQIARLLDSPDVRKRMGRNGRILVESVFSWPRVALAMEDQYSRIVARRRRF
ncbi:MAG TPA: glycosyltransferase [Thermoanaerobaculia bacterium]